MKSESQNRQSSILVVALWFGVVAGLLEGLGLWMLQSFDLLTWKMKEAVTAVKIIWITPTVYLLLFGAAGVVLWFLARIAPRLDWMRIAVFLFGGLALIDILSVPGRLARTAVLTLGCGLATVLVRWYRTHARPALSFWKGTLPWLVSIVLLGGLGIEAGLRIQERRAVAALPAPDPHAPNVLIILIDTLRADKLSWYGYARNTSPNIDRIGGEGVTFDGAIAPSSWTLPSHASLLTGVPPHVHGAEIEALKAGFPTLPGALLERGYRTAAFSGNTEQFSRAWGFGPGFLLFDDSFYSTLDDITRTLYGRAVVKAWLRMFKPKGPGARRTASNVTQSALHWIGRQEEHPFFAFLNYFDVHHPYAPSQPWRSRYSKRDDPASAINGIAGHDYPPLPAEDLQGARDAYDGGIAYIDDQIGVLLGELERRNLAKNTMVIITSDHGEDFGDHGMYFHTNALYWELVHVPLIVRWPGRVPAGVRISTPVSLTNLPATILELLGNSQQRTFPGPSLAALWEKLEMPREWPDPLSELAKLNYGPASKAPSYYGAMRSLVTPKWHYILHEKFGPQLYDRERDPEELRNLAATPDRAELVRRFGEELRALGAYPFAIHNRGSSDSK